MKKRMDKQSESQAVDSQRRHLLKAAGAGVLAATFSGVAIAGADKSADGPRGHRIR